MAGVFDEFLIMLYCLVVLWLNLGYLHDQPEEARGIAELSPAEDLAIKQDSIPLLTLSLAFNFSRRWLFYMLASIVTGNLLVKALSVALFAVSLHNSMPQQKTSVWKRKRKRDLRLFLAIADAFFITGFLIWLIWT
ncbi:hypothetical protein [Bhargavaea beijingensis]|uniref:Uncharacterized protein n=1 Tax=Bhargavaea beijingensis TaxID=426756 RepID=A0A1G6YQY3_9BACL|nr:hypothetical protein [Bhargavaea beijingensis]MCW1928650.1 hypothetical protein [Bhargavaea beijingensis]RSK36648.1 hypothetical protein EJA12_02555 [Bhargavaea beijingensis]SDD92778.1 hypothetical protein SAMN04488126_10254 [Bhargavaea beijingensis]